MSEVLYGSVDILMREETPESTDDPNRKELLWEEREENLLLGWATDCKITSELHGLQSKKNKKLYAIFGIPSIFIPIVLGGVSNVIPCNSLIYSLAMMVTGLFSGFGMFYNFSKKEIEHSEYQNKFLELSIDIDLEICKPKFHRVACDLFLERIKLKYTALRNEQPNL
jgi:hypothetical protein